MYARMLLHELGALLGMFWWLRNLRREPGNKGVLRMKVAVITGETPTWQHLDIWTAVCCDLLSIAASLSLGQ